MALSLTAARSNELYKIHTANEFICHTAEQARQAAIFHRSDIKIVEVNRRLGEMFGQDACAIGTISYFVMDEADRVLDYGKIYQIMRIYVLQGGNPPHQLMPPVRFTIFVRRSPGA